MGRASMPRGLSPWYAVSQGVGWRAERDYRFVTTPC